MPRRIVMLLLVAGAMAAFGSPAARASLNLPSKPQAPKIVGGRPDPYNDTNWVAAVLQKGYGRGGGFGQSCTASLIDRRYVLTAAHCSLNDRETRVLNPRKLEVRLGSKRWDRSGVLRRVKRIYVYPHYNPRTAYGDLSILKLSGPVNIRTPYLVSSGTSYITNPRSQAYIAGWGSLRNRHGPYPHTLYSTWVWLLPDRYCNGVNPRFNGSVMICAGAQGRGTCYGDSGGPLAVWDGRWWWLVGATSYGPCTGNSAYAWVGSPPLHRWLTGS